MSASRKILDGLTEALAHARGELDEAPTHRIKVPDQIDVQSVRTKLGLTQAQFAMQFGFKLATLRNWEQAKRVPEAPARALLQVIDREPDAVKRALAIA